MTEAMSDAHILIVEDNTDLAYGLQNNLEIEGHSVTVVKTGREAIEQTRSKEFDLLILDLMIPEVDGFRVLKTIRGDRNNIPVLILTSRGEEADKVQGLRIGADDYVTKPFSVLELIARVDAILRRRSTGNNGSAEDIYRFSNIEVNTKTREIYREGKQLSLTPLEFDLLVALLKRKDQAVRRDELLKEVWGHTADVYSRTVDTHIAELRKKIERKSSKPEFILTVPKTGYRLKV